MNKEHEAWLLQQLADLDATKARLAEAEKDATRSRHEWQRECEDTDLLLQGMGLCPSEYRSECGSLLLARIRHKMGHIGLRLDETLARLAEAEAQNSVLWDAANDRNQRLDHAEALLLETCERMSEAETTSRVLTGQLPEYSEGQQMLRSLAAKMGDSVKRIRAFLAPDSASEEGEK